MPRKIKYFLIFSLSCLALVLLSAPVLAQVNVGTNEISQAIKLSAANPIAVAARIVNIFLLILGIVAVGLIIFAGFKWMTSEGNEEKVTAARKILQNAAIGLVIILAAWGIVTFIFSQLLGTGGTGNGLQGMHTINSGSGFGALGSCTVQSVYPEPGQTDIARNSAILLTFKEAVKLDTMCVDSVTKAACACDTNTCNRINPNNIRIYKNADGDTASSTPDLNLTDVVVTVAPDQENFVLKPQTYLGSDTSDTDYTVYLSNDIADANGKPIFDTCATDYMKWGFTVSTKLDLTPPQVLSVTAGGIFPIPDNTQDQTVTSTVLATAQGSLEVLSDSNVYAAPMITSVATTTASCNSATATADNNYQGGNKTLTVTIASSTKAQLSAGANVLDQESVNNGQIIFPNYLTLNIGGDHSWAVGNSWTIAISGGLPADTITVGGDVYTFTNASSTGYTIQKKAGLDNQAAEISLVLSGRSDITVSRAQNKVTITAAAGGSSGNDIGLETNNSSDFKITPLSGGQDAVVNTIVADKKDQPMNSIIQINFNKPILPTGLVGNGTVYGLVIENVSSLPGAAAGHICTSDVNCLSGKCVNNACVGSTMSGNFTISNGYKTVEFRSNIECGMNSCGDKIYCLPGNAKIQVILYPADLATCSSNNDCSGFSPYNTCALASVGVVGGRTYDTGYNVCQDASGHNYPLSAATSTGIRDASLNSFDGNRDGNPDGQQKTPIYYTDATKTVTSPTPTPYINYSYMAYNENVPNVKYRDRYFWTFWTSNKIEATPPTITAITPTGSSSSTSLTDPATITFDRLMRSDTLKTGTINMTVGTTTVTHDLINLRSQNSSAPGYWVTNENLDINPADGEMDTTMAKINHSPFLDGVSYTAQAGSGVTDIYQNCFKPSSGPGCTIDPSHPEYQSCCSGVWKPASSCQ